METAETTKETEQSEPGSQKEVEPKILTGAMDEPVEQTSNDADNSGSKPYDEGVPEEEDQAKNIQSGPKIKIGTGKPKKPKHSRKTEDSESDIPCYSMRVRPTPRGITVSRRLLRNQRDKDLKV